MITGRGNEIRSSSFFLLRHTIGLDTAENILIAFENTIRLSAHILIASADTIRLSADSLIVSADAIRLSVHTIRLSIDSLIVFSGGSSFCSLIKEEIKRIFERAEKVSFPKSDTNDIFLE